MKKEQRDKAEATIAKRIDKGKKLVLESLSKGNTRTAAAGVAGICRQQLYEWIKADQVFEDAMEVAEAVAESVVADKLHEKAKGGHVISMIFFLKSRCGWREYEELQQKFNTLEEALRQAREKGEQGESPGSKSGRSPRIRVIS